jgi:hypothetical protein
MTSASSITTSSFYWQDLAQDPLNEDELVYLSDGIYVAKDWEVQRAIIRLMPSTLISYASQPPFFRYNR